MINSKIHNVFIAALGYEVQYYSALCRSLDSSLGNMIETLAMSIAELHYEVKRHVDGVLYRKQTDFIADLLERYKNTRGSMHMPPSIGDYRNIVSKAGKGEAYNKRHESDYYLIDRERGLHYLIELKVGGDLDNKKARSEKEALLEQYCILSNSLGSDNDVMLFFATAYNRYGEGKPWAQGRVRQFFAEEELLISRDFWNLICKTDRGFDIVIGEYRRNAHIIREALEDIKYTYMPDNE